VIKKEIIGNDTMRHVQGVGKVFGYCLYSCGNTNWFSLWLGKKG